MSTSLSPDNLWLRLATTWDRALVSGALRPITTCAQVLHDGGIDFVVRLAQGLAYKPSAYERGARDEPPRRDPFRDPEPELTVGDLSATHRCVLNKFPVVERHALLVTRAFEDQESPLTVADFVALATGLRAFDALGFYNGGPAAGASQRHKHLQLVPLPLDGGATGAPSLPLEALLDSAALDPAGAPVALPQWPFAHGFVGLDPTLEPQAAGEEMRARYVALLTALGLSTEAPAPYNLLATRRWLLVVARRTAQVQGVEVNGLGFAGAFFARDPAALERIVAHGPMAMLREVAEPFARL